jgi:Ala-tRNA(Pro) deacylase
MVPRVTEEHHGRATPEDLFHRLEELGVAVSTVEHPAVFTVEESKALRGELPGGHTKCLLLRDSKKQLWLVVAGADERIDLKDLRSLIDSGRLSFASAEQLVDRLGVTAGAVSPFAVINDGDGSVGVVLDSRILDHSVLNFHPLDNTMTTAIAPSDLLRFLEATNHQPLIIDL